MKLRANLVKSAPTVFVILMIAFYRLLPHPWNFTPVCATAIFAGIYLNKRLAILLPILSMFIADLFLGLDWLQTPLVYVSIVLSSMIGSWVGSHRETVAKFALGILGGTVLSAVLFFIITNFAAWITLEYTKDLAGLAQCYVLAIPFFKNTLAGDLFYITIFVLVYEGVHRWASSRVDVAAVHAK